MEATVKDIATKLAAVSVSRFTEIADKFANISGTLESYIPSIDDEILIVTCVGKNCYEVVESSNLDDACASHGHIVFIYKTGGVSSIISMFRCAMIAKNVTTDGDKYYVSHLTLINVLTKCITDFENEVHQNELEIMFNDIIKFTYEMAAIAKIPIGEIVAGIKEETKPASCDCKSVKN